MTRRQVLGLGSLSAATILSAGCTGAKTRNTGGSREWRVPVANPLYTAMDANAGQVFLSTRSGLVAVHADTGTIMWKFPSGWQYPNPPVASADTTYIIGAENSTLHAISNHSGHQQWSFTMSGCALIGPLVHGLVVYVAAGQLPNGVARVFALNARNGKTLWIANGLDPALIADDVLYTFGSDGLLRALATDTGRELWAFASPSGSFHGTPKLSGYTCYVSCDLDDVGGTQSRVIALDRETGAPKWTADLSGGSPVSLQITPRFVYAAADTLGVVGAVKGNVIAADARTGAIAWTTTVPDLGSGTLIAGNSLLVSGTPPARDGGIVKAGGSIGETELCALDLSTGKARWRSAGPGSWISAAPRQAANDIIAGYGKSVRAINMHTGKTTWSAPIKIVQGPIIAGGQLLAVTANNIAASGAVGEEGALNALTL